MEEDIKIKEPLRTSEMDSKFAEEIASHPGGEKIFMCYQCGACAGSCPVGRITNSFRPRQIIRLALLGARNEVLTSNSIWMCASCYTCQERCPQGLEIADLMLAIRNIAAEEGRVPDAMMKQALLLIESGRLVQITGLTKSRRTTLGLPFVTSAPMEDIKKIMIATSFNKLIEQLRSQS